MKNQSDDLKGLVLFIAFDKGIILLNITVITLELNKNNNQVIIQI